MQIRNAMLTFNGWEFLYTDVHKQGSLGYMTGEVTRGSHSFKPDVVCSDSAALCDWEGALLTWEVTLWCYQELVCFYKLVTAVWEHLIALLHSPRVGFYHLRILAAASFKGRIHLYHRHASC